MSNQIAVFNFNQNEVRTTTHQNGEIYFCLKDVANVLDIKNHNEIVKNQLNKDGVDKIYLTDNLNRKQQVTFINEPNLYRVIFRSNKEEAIVFQNWVFEEVLPTIRKTGGYYIKISETQRKILADAVRSRCGHEKTYYSKVWKTVKDFFGVEVYSDIPGSGFTQALQIIKTVELPTMIETTQAPQQLLPKETVSKAMDYISSLCRQIVQLGGTLPKCDIDSDSLAIAYTQRLLMSKRMTVSFDETGNPNLRLIPQQSWIVTNENIENIVGDPCGIDKSHLPNIIVSATNRLYPTKKGN